MADNYLERQREAYEARKAAWLKANKYKRKKATAQAVNPSTTSPAVSAQAKATEDVKSPQDEHSSQK